MTERKPGRQLLIDVGMKLSPALSRIGIDLKRLYELAYWRLQAAREGTLTNSFYRALFTEVVGLDTDSYRNKRVLDIGCGPRGSLEWLDVAALRVGLDPLALGYRRHSIGRHGMSYVAGAAERLPFADSSLDVVTSFNSLDHVDHLDSSLSEVGRVLAPGGFFVLLVEVHPAPTLAEPIALPWDLSSRIATDFAVVREDHFEIAPQRRGAAAAARAGVPFDHGRADVRSGALLAVYRRS